MTAHVVVMAVTKLTFSFKILVLAANIALKNCLHKSYLIG